MQPSTPRLDDTTGQQWRDIFTNPHHTGQTWACVAVAIAHADEVVRHAARGTVTSHDPPSTGLVHCGSRQRCPVIRC